MTYTIHVCSECGQVKKQAGGGHRAVRTFDWCWHKVEEVEVIPRALADELVEALGVCAHSTDAGYKMKFGAIAKYKETIEA